MHIKCLSMNTKSTYNTAIGFLMCVYVLNFPVRFGANGSLTRYAKLKLRVKHAPGMPGTPSPPPTSKETASYQSRHASLHVRQQRAVMHVGIDNPRWRWKRFWHSWHSRNPQFHVSDKRPMRCITIGMKQMGVDGNSIVIVCNYETHRNSKQTANS